MSEAAWTRDRPQVAGWYWHRNKLLPVAKASVVEVVKTVTDDLLVCWNLSHIKMEDVSPESEWLGPITPDSYQQAQEGGVGDGHSTKV